MHSEVASLNDPAICRDPQTLKCVEQQKDPDVHQVPEIEDDVVAKVKFTSSAVGRPILLPANLHRVFPT